ncbi:MAG: hypothetical protein LBV04_00905 [Deferribacteraceae bacterium]|jgi:hypothetical protein|nr:hypothetical protein [Deferribacteraceae bacterium]
MHRTLGFNSGKDTEAGDQDYSYIAPYIGLYLPLLGDDKYWGSGIFCNVGLPFVINGDSGMGISLDTSLKVRIPDVFDWEWDSLHLGMGYKVHRIGGVDAHYNHQMYVSLAILTGD